MGGGGVGRRTAALTHAETLGFGLLVLVLAVDGGGVALLAAVEAAATAARPPADHGGEDDLDAVQVGGQVGSCKGGEGSDEEEQRESGEELHGCGRDDP